MTFNLVSRVAMMQVSWECSKFSFNVLYLTFTFPPSSVVFITGSSFNYLQRTFGGEGAGFINNLIIITQVDSVPSAEGNKKTHAGDSPTGGTPCARDGGLGCSGPSGGRPGPHAGLGAGMELGLQWLEARGFLAGAPGSCLVFRSGVPAQSPRQVQLPREPGGGSASPPHAVAATGPWLPGAGGQGS